MYGFRPPHVQNLRPKKRSSCAPGQGLPDPGLKVESPDPLVTSGDCLPDESCGGEPREQAQSRATVNLAAAESSGELLAIEHCRLRQNRNAKEVLGKEDFSSVESRGLEHPLRNVEPRA